MSQEIEALLSDLEKKRQELNIAINVIQAWLGQPQVNGHASIPPLTEKRIFAKRLQTPEDHAAKLMGKHRQAMEALHAFKGSVTKGKAKRTGSKPMKGYQLLEAMIPGEDISPKELADRLKQDVQRTGISLWTMEKAGKVARVSVGRYMRPLNLDTPALVAEHPRRPKDRPALLATLKPVSKLILQLVPPPPAGARAEDLMATGRFKISLKVMRQALYRLTSIGLLTRLEPGLFTNPPRTGAAMPLLASLEPNRPLSPLETKIAAALRQGPAATARIVYERDRSMHYKSVSAALSIMKKRGYVRYENQVWSLPEPA